MICPISKAKPPKLKDVQRVLAFLSQLTPEQYDAIASGERFVRMKPSAIAKQLNIDRATLFRRWRGDVYRVVRRGEVVEYPLQRIIDGPRQVFGRSDQVMAIKPGKAKVEVWLNEALATAKVQTV